MSTSDSDNYFALLYRLLSALFHNAIDLVFIIFAANFISLSSLKQSLSKFFDKSRNDEIVKSQQPSFFVIPAEAGIQ